MTSTADLPQWAWDLVIVLLRYEAEHAEESDAFTLLLNAIPTDVRHEAAVIQAYFAQAHDSAVAHDAQDTWNYVQELIERAAASQTRPR